MVAFKGSLLPSYAQLRATFASVPIFYPSWTPTLPILPANGTIILSALYPDEG